MIALLLTVVNNWVVEIVSVQREAICGNPNLSTATVCHMERYFLTMGQSNKRCARKTSGGPNPEVKKAGIAYDDSEE